MWPRKLLFPFSILYDGITAARNKLFDYHFFESKNYELPVICVGNLNLGGTGKSPMVQYLLQILHAQYHVATLSRGYKRETNGFYLLEGNETAKEVGDEPLQFKTNFPEASIAVDEDRQHGIAQLMNLRNPDVMILDDAFQHRKVRAGLNILLSAYGSLYVDDLVLPAGNLRESKAGANRADVVVVTKCPENLSEKEIFKIEKKLNLKPNQKLFFSGIKYQEKVKNQELAVDLIDFLQEKFVLVTGIANPQPLLDFLKQKNARFEHLKFNDHHQFTEAEIKNLQHQGPILTTEKDFMRLKNKISAPKIFYLPIEVHFFKNEKSFNRQIFEFVKQKTEQL